MAKTYNTLTIEVKEDITDIITAKQDDTQSRYLDVRLQDDGQPINLTGNEVRIYGRKKDGTSFFNDGTITDAVNGRCQFELTNQALAVVGDVAVEISIWQNNQRILTTQTFKVYVVPKIRDDNAIESSNEFGALVVLFQKLYDFWLDIEKTLGKPNDTGGTETTGTVMAKLNQLLMDISQQSDLIQYKISDIVRHTTTKNVPSAGIARTVTQKIYQFHAKYDGCICAYATTSAYGSKWHMYVMRSLHDYVNTSGSIAGENGKTMTHPSVYTAAVGSILSSFLVPKNITLSSVSSSFSANEETNLIYGSNHSSSGDYKGTVLLDTTIPVKKGEEVVFIASGIEGTDVTLELKYDEAKI